MDIYQKLATHLDQMPVGYPPTESGVELRILRKLFSEEQASLAVQLHLVPEPAAQIAGRVGMDNDRCMQLLQEMEQKGLIFSLAGEGETLYMAAQFIVGIWEFSVNSLDEELIRDVNEYIPTLVDYRTWKEVPQLRTIPLSQSITVEHQALPYEMAEELVADRRKYLVAPCICRKEHAMVGKGCGKPEETCLIFDESADYYEKRGIGRVIDKEETLQIMQLAEQHSLVLQPSNFKNPMSICLCCGCCCQALKMLKRAPRPADAFTSPFVIQTTPDNCVGCEVCIGRCPMEALEMVDGKSAVIEGRCIGCGVCVSTCPTDALHLVRSEQQPKVPETVMEMMANLGETRIKITRKGDA